MSGGAGAGGPGGLRLEEALRLVLENVPGPPLETVALDEALGRALPQAISAAIDQPPFDKSAMDGYAHASPLPAPEGPWRVVGLSAAGSARPGPLGPGECLRIMTGAMLPSGATAVQRFEWTEAPDAPTGALVRFTRAETRDNVIRRGENQKAGDLLLGPRVLAAQDIGILASSGYHEVLAARRTRVAVVSTGDELAAPGSPLASGAIYDSNGPQLVACARAFGCDARFLGIVRDDEDELAAAFERALAGCDVLIVSGGVSVGDFDHVPRALARGGVETVFHGLAMKPGRPLLFGRKHGSATGAGAAVFGLPGNPVSTFVAFEVLVLPHLAARSGLAWEPRYLGARLESEISHLETDRVEFLPARLGRGEDGLPSVRPLEYRGSSMLSALAQADCLIEAGIGVERLLEGSVVHARLVRP